MLAPEAPAVRPFSLWAARWKRAGFNSRPVQVDPSALLRVRDAAPAPLLEISVFASNSRASLLSPLGAFRSLCVTNRTFPGPTGRTLPLICPPVALLKAERLSPRLMCERHLRTLARTEARSVTTVPSKLRTRHSIYRLLPASRLSGQLGFVSSRGKE